MKRDLDKMSSTEYDLVIVGAGIYGVSAAWDAALRGLKVALIDKGDFGAATSANSLKTIHGGIRYLQQLDFKRMRESIHERMVLMRIAPHLIYPLPVIMPTYSYKLKSRPALFAALLANDIVGFDRNKLGDPQKFMPMGQLLSKREVQEYIPGYGKYNMSGGALWYDCQCYNTERLTISYVLSAFDGGADVANYVECTGFILDGSKVTGIKARDFFTGGSLNMRAKVIVNTCGPWVEKILSNLGVTEWEKRFIGSSAMNIIINRKLLDKHAAGLSGPYQFVRKDGSIYKAYRILFFSPWRHYTIIGTNHLPYYGDPNDYRVTETEIRDFLGAVNQAYPAAKIKREEVTFFHGGLLPMVGTRPDTGEVQLLKRYGIYDHSKEDKIDGLITIVGVKYTTHRDIASKTVDLVFKKLGRKSPRCLTEEKPVYGGEIERFEKFLAEAINESNLSANATRRLVHNYGSRYRDVLGALDKDGTRPIDGSDEVIRAEIIHGIRDEMALRLSDVVLRRTDLGSGGNPGERTLRAVAEIMADELGWSKERTDKELQETKAIYNPAN